MGNFKDSLKNWFYTNSSAAATSTSRIPLLDASGNPIGSDTLDNILNKQPLFTGNVGVVSYENNNPRFKQPTLAEDYASTAIGVWIRENDKLVIVAKDQSSNTLTWANSQASGGTAYKELAAAYADMDGRTNTSTIITTLGTDAPAAKYCQDYVPSNVDSADTKFGAGRWWLPSLGELWMIWAHLLEVNRLLARIGGTQIGQTGGMWSSTERTETTAWYFYKGLITTGFKDESGFIRARPVTSYY